MNPSCSSWSGASLCERLAPDIQSEPIRKSNQGSRNDPEGTVSTVPPPCRCEVDMRKGTEVVEVHVELTNDRCCWSRQFAQSTWLTQLIKLHPHNNSWFQMTAVFIKTLRGCPFVICCESIIKLPLIRSWRGWTGRQSMPTSTHTQDQFRVNVHVVGRWKGGEESGTPGGTQTPPLPLPRIALGQKPVVFD